MNTSGDDLICVLFSITPILRANYSFSNREATIEMGYSVGLLTGHAKKVIALFISRSRNVLLRPLLKGGALLLSDIVVLFFYDELSR